ncbi:hypothetical protein MNBD_GAMMA06-1176 [hydrothermal vent metagenome]|uniref:DUF2846 domain-containing protein n=1 Tax=hydrothermal vent metagenome TaxID=652676 RepID=A0A3B0X9M6_9ZZZZ
MQGTNFVLNKSFVIFSFIFFTAYLSACSNNSEVTAFTPAAVKPEKTLVYIYRPTEASNALYSPGINIDGEFNFYAKNSLNMQITLAPGKHIFEFQAEKIYSELTPLSVKLTAGQTYFIRVNSSLTINNASTYEPYLRIFKLTQVDKQQAKQEIAECCVVKAKKTTKKTKETSTDKKSGDGFSVDKTQNPFSH